MAKKIVNLILAVVLLLNIVSFFVPYWTVDDNGVSIAGYILLPKEHKDLTKELKEVTGEKKLLTNVAFPLFICLLVDVVGFAAGLLLLKTRIAAIFALLSGFVHGFAFMTDIIVKGQSLWIIYIIAAVVTSLAGLVQLLIFSHYPPDDDL